MNDNFRSFTNNQQMIAHMRKLAKESKTTTEVILEEYTLDDFVQRIAKSKYINNLILKGGFLLSSLMGINNRTTEDIDTDIKGKDLSLPEVTKMVDEICEIIPVKNDPITIERVGKIEKLHEGARYVGYRVHLLGTLYDKSRANIKIDVSTGDVITPKEIKYTYKSLIDGTPIEIAAYNNETIIAQKLETVFSRSIANTRMKDFYDLYMLNNLRKLTGYQQLKLDLPLTKQALINTAMSRKSYDEIFEKLDDNQFLWQFTFSEIESNAAMKKKWENYTHEKAYAENIEFQDTLIAIKELMTELFSENLTVKRYK